MLCQHGALRRGRGFQPFWEPRPGTMLMSACVCMFERVLGGELAPAAEARPEGVCLAVGSWKWEGRGCLGGSHNDNPADRAV